MSAATSKKVYEVFVKDSGFSRAELAVPQGKTISFLIDDKITRNENNDEIGIVQVIKDEELGNTKEDKVNWRPVVGGYRSLKGANKLSAKFKLAGCYFFKLINHPGDPPVFKLTINEEVPLTFLITDNGFMPRIIRIEEHTSIKWQWSKVSFPHSIYEADYCDFHNGIYRTTKELATKSLSNSYKRTFKEPGLYYFQTESKNPEVKHICIVEVHQSFRDRGIEIFDNKFSPARLTIEEGDRVIFHWNKCEKKHCIYEIEPPLPDHPLNQAYFPKKEGFKWPVPSLNGSVIHKFDTCGVYYFSDISDEESASYIGIIAVKQKSETHILDYNEESKNFGADLITMETGDTIFWKWSPPAEIVINLSDYSFLGNKKIQHDICKVTGGCDMFESSLAKIGIRAYNIRYAGIYYFEINNGDDKSIMTVVATAAQKDHKIVIGDNEVKPKILEIYPEDRVWFVWDDTRKPKNIRQVDHQNEIVPGGFLSGSLMESPGTFMHSFADIGVYHYRTDNINEILGAVVVVPEPTIQLVSINETGLNPDPMVVHMNDVVIWAFSKYQANDVVLIDDETDLIKYSQLSRDILPRRHLSYSFKEPGVYHFASPAFDQAIQSTELDATKGLDNTIISTVIVDKINDYSPVIIDSAGFHPNVINVELSKNVLFDWTDSSHEHNIIHVAPPDEQNVIKIIKGPNAFNSGKLIAHNKFLHRFDKPGKFCVVSEGVKGAICTINVLVSASKTDMPELTQKEPYVVYKFHKVYLACKTPASKIHYTTDGSTPHELSPVYDEDFGVVLNEEGISVVRAIAYAEDYLTSNIFTSQRFYVIPDPNDTTNDKYNEVLNEQDSSKSNKDWWLCIPKIRYTIIGVSCVEITWDAPNEQSLELISHYQLFLNNVSYKPAIVSNTNRILVKGLAGGKSYDTILMVYPKSQALMPQQSNALHIKCAMTTPLGGPIISLKSTPKKNQVCLCWQSIDCKKTPIGHYQLLINGELKETIHPKPGMHRVTIESVKEGVNYSIILVAIPKRIRKKLVDENDDDVNALISNEFEITLPLDIDKITLPDASDRRLEKDYYDEYMEIIEYENPIPEPLTVEPDKDLPVPKIGVSHLRPGVIHIQWHLVNLPPREFKLTHYVIILTGCEFGNTIKSDASYECKMDVNGVETPAVQHSWIMKSETMSFENKFTIEGILDTAVYQICVNAVYRYMDSSEYKKASKVIDYTALGPPLPPRLKASTTDIQCISLEWIMDQYPKPEFIKGFQLIVDSEPNQVFQKSINEFLFKDMQPGKQYDLEIKTLTNWIVGSSQPSNKLNLICPYRPQAPLITQLPNTKPYTVMIGWKPVKTRSSNKHDKILSYKVYVNKAYHGEIFSNNSSSYSYMIDDLVPGKSYHTMVQALCGEKVSYPTDGPKVSCIVASEFSNDLSVNTAAPPGPTRVRLAAIHPDGIDITWNFPEQYGDATCSGFQLVRNGKCYGSILPPEVNTYRIGDIEIGDLLNLQIISLTNHPVGKYSALQNHPDYTMDQPQREFIINGSESVDNDKHMSNMLKSFPGCLPGPALSVKFTGLVKPATKLWTERITGYTAMAIFNTSRMNSHFVDPDYFLISYWPGDEPDENVTTVKTENDYVKLSNLKPSTKYTLMVESRKELKRSEDIVDMKEKNEYKYIVYSQSSQIQFHTASPPDPPTNLAVESSTCHSIKIRWDPPIDHGSELLATRVDCYPLNVDAPLHIYKELTPDTKCCIIENLSEKTNYRITVTVITEEYLVYHKIKEISKIPNSILSSIPWLPSAYIDTRTSGTDPASSLSWAVQYDNSISLSWKLPKVYGTNYLVNQVVCYQLINNDDSMAMQIPIQSDVIGYRLTELIAGNKYRIWIEAVICMRLNLDSNMNEYVYDSDDASQLRNKINYYKELKDNRCVNVSSEHLLIRVPAPCEPPQLSLTGYTNETIDIYWPKPSLFSQHRHPDDSQQRISLYRHLIGYKLLVNEIQQRSLHAHETSCTLTKCKQLNTYNIVLVALTCIPDETNDKLYPLIKREINIDEIDESMSEPLQVKTFAGDRHDQLNYVLGQYEDAVDPGESRSIGRIRVEWAIQNDEDVAQYNVIWYSATESINQRKSVDSTTRLCYVPVTAAKAIYEIQVVIIYRSKSKSDFTSEVLFIETPGSPEAPILWLKEIKNNNAHIRWSDPRVYPNVPVSGYQIYLNDVKICKVDKYALKHTIPLKINKSYKVNIQALSSKSEHPHSAISMPLHINSSTKGRQTQAADSVSAESFAVNSTDLQVLSLKKHYELENESEFDGETTIPIKVQKLSEEYIDIDWSTYVKHDSFDEFKIYWHCLDTNEHFEHRCSPSVLTYRIKKLRSGYSYCIRIAAIQNNSVIVNKSKYYIIQTCASPDTPILKLRARNSNYITLEWSKPMTYGDAKIVGYKIYIDGKAEAVLSSETTTYTLSKGEPCHEYSFQIQAICNNDKYSSLISPPVLAIWPGIIAPGFREMLNDNGIIKVAWDEPIIAGTTKVSYYRVISECQLTNEITIHGPFENNVRECEIRNMNVGKHKLTLEIYACGISLPFTSSPIFIDFAYTPEPPTLVIQLPGLEKRTKLDNIACNLCNKRDRLLKIVTNSSMSRNKNHNKSLIPKAMSTLRQLDDGLNDCLKLIANYTGYFIANLSWTCEQPNPMIKLSGFRVYINGRQYGMDLNNTVRTIRIKLSLERAIHSVFVTSFTEKPRTESKISNKLELLSESFFPFSFYCYQNVHNRSACWPEKGCCAFDDSLSLERINLSKTREPINIGLLNEPVPAPKCQVIEMATGKTKSLIEGKSKSGKSTILLFWTKWCLASIRILNYIVMYAQRNNTQNEYIACHHGMNSYESDNSDEVFELIKQAGYLDYNIRFVSDIQHNVKHGRVESSSLDLFDVKGVPSILILNRSGYIVWKGRFCAYDYPSFESFMHHTLSECINAKCPMQNCDICNNDISIENDLYDLRKMLKITDQYSEAIVTPNNDVWAVTNANLNLPPKISTKSLISAKLKPYNITNMNSKGRANNVVPNINSVYFNKEQNRKIYQLN